MGLIESTRKGQAGGQKRIEDVLETSEKIIWRGIVNRRFLRFKLSALFLLIFIFSIFLMSGKMPDATSSGLPISSVKIGWLIVLVCLLFAAINYFYYSIQEYVLTNKRVLLKSGLIGTDFNSIYFTEIKSASVQVDLIDKIFSIGTINIDTGKVETYTTGDSQNRTSQTRPAYDKLLHLEKPYEAYQFFQSALSQYKENLYAGQTNKTL